MISKHQCLNIIKNAFFHWTLNDFLDKDDVYICCDFSLMPSCPFYLQLAKEIREIYENDAIFSIIASTNSVKVNDQWEKDASSVCSADYLYNRQASK